MALLCDFHFSSALPFIRTKVTSFSTPFVSSFDMHLLNMANPLGDLAKLPAELRNNVYKLALRDDRTTHHLRNHVKLPPLLMTSREFRNEALKVFIYENDWTVQRRKHQQVPGCYIDIGEGTIFEVTHIPHQQPNLDSDSPLSRRLRILGDHHLRDSYVELRMGGGEDDKPRLEHGDACPTCAPDLWPKVPNRTESSAEMDQRLHGYRMDNIICHYEMKILEHGLRNKISVSKGGLSVKNSHEIASQVQGWELNAMRGLTGDVQGNVAEWRKLYEQPTTGADS